MKGFQQLLTTVVVLEMSWKFGHVLVLVSLSEMKVSSCMLPSDGQMEG